MIAVPVIVAIVVVAAIIGTMSIPFFPRMLVGSGHLVTNQEQFTGFTAVEVSSGFQFTVKQANSYSVNVTIDDNLVNYVQISKSGNTLSVGLAPGYGYQSAPPKVEIAMPDITQLSLSGGSSGSVNGFILSHDFTALVSGGSSVSMSGRAQALSIEGSGGSQLNLLGFTVTNAQVNLSGGSRATISLNGVLNANLSGGSQLYYTGNPTMGNINTSGGSIVSRR